MPVALAPAALTALRVGTIALTAYAIARKTRRAPKHIWRETALDEAPDGIEITTDRGESEANAHASGRFRRVFRVGTGRGVEIDISGLARFRVRRSD